VPEEFSVAPMLDVTDRHCRMFLRQLSARAKLYTEMTVDNALIHGERARFLDFDPRERACDSTRRATRRDSPSARAWQRPPTSTKST